MGVLCRLFQQVIKLLLLCHHALPFCDDVVVLLVAFIPIRNGAGMGPEWGEKPLALPE